MSLTTVRAAIANATKRQAGQGCGPAKVRLGETRAVIAAAKADGRVSGVERKEIKSFYESRAFESQLSVGSRQTKACPESTDPVFTLPADRHMSNFLYGTGGGGSQFTQAIPENP